MEPIILASSSLRRQEYFKLLGLPFSVMPAKIDESLCTQTDPEKHTSELAVKKIESVIEEMRNRPPKWICGVDTVIATEEKIYGKPKNREEAGAMLKELSGRWHKAVTSIAIYNGSLKKMDIKSASCTVDFASLSEKEIEWYLDTNEWQTVAGAYRIQGLASCFITKIEGSPTTVVGLPLREFYVMLRDNGYPYGA
jgi:septum formation protein